MTGGTPAGVPVVHDFAGWPEGPLHLAIGVFDGVHLGHRALISHLAAEAAGAGAAPVAATFDPLPIQVVAPGAPASALSSAHERTRLLGEAGASAVVLFHFDERFASLTAREFVAGVAGAGETHRVVVGADFQFGHGREGDVRTLAKLGTQIGFEVDVFPPFEIDGASVSSTRIRNALAAGAVEEAARLLGRPYAVPGEVVHGSSRGRGLGYPTINIATPPERLLPKDGIYAMRVGLDGREYAAAASLGVRPTFGGGPKVLEAHLLDFQADAYGRRAMAAFVRRLRDERHFGTPEELTAQIAKDVEATREALC
ncbi:MAG: bifunctional riboflavin kinase/FAD synthetase [Chloroflexota bacterium]|nr:bifunctional riboflavin kinase/FAD synthetase [Chloroflexota bacterium]